MKIDTKTLKKAAAAITTSLFLLVGAASSLSLRGDLDMPNQYNFILGSILLAFVLVDMFTSIYNSKDKE